MNKNDIYDLIDALRCSASELPERNDCKNCKYRLLEKLDEEFPMQPDVYIDGVGYWQSCDVERIAFDATDALYDLVKD